jgi:hypothetical protein
VNPHVSEIVVEQALHIAALFLIETSGVAGFDARAGKRPLARCDVACDAVIRCMPGPEF